MSRALAILGFAYITAMPAAAQNAVTVGYRSDAPPFSALAQDGRTVDGFLVYLCDGALAEAGLEVTRVDVTAENRFALLDLPPEAGGVDMLCDPMSINEERAEKYILSQQVFATGVGFLRRKGPPPLGSDASRFVRVGYLEGTTAGTAVDIAEAWGVLNLVEGAEVERQPDDLTIGTHYEGVAAVCSGHLWFYFGDLDILKALKARVEQSGVDCSSVQTGVEVFSYEAYALPVAASEAALAISLQAGLYKMFSDPDVYTHYDKYFDGQPRSPILQALFALNGVFTPSGLVGKRPGG